jgi:ADP-ribose pyrophosphatase YjhB (NUDIX family)
MPEATRDDPAVRFCALCGAALLRQERQGALRPCCPACDHVHFFDPKVAAAAWIEEDGRLLLVRRAVMPQRGLWTIPGGYVDAWEDPASAVLRECAEELGVAVELTGLLDIVAGREHPRGAGFVIFYSARLRTRNLQPADDVDQVGWFGAHELPVLAFEATRSMTARWQAALGAQKPV